MPTEENRHDARWRHVAEQLRAVNHVLEPLAQSASCILVAEKDFEGKGTLVGAACRIKARAQYLFDVLDCEANPTPTCCDDAAQAYCDAFEGCPD